MQFGKVASFIWNQRIWSDASFAAQENRTSFSIRFHLNFFFFGSFVKRYWKTQNEFCLLFIKQRKVDVHRIANSPENNCSWVVSCVHYYWWRIWLCGNDLARIATRMFKCPIYSVWATVFACRLLFIMFTQFFALNMRNVKRLTQVNFTIPCKLYTCVMIQIIAK